MVSDGGWIAGADRSRTGRAAGGAHRSGAARSAIRLSHAGGGRGEGDIDLQPGIALWPDVDVVTTEASATHLNV